MRSFTKILIALAFAGAVRAQAPTPNTIVSDTIVSGSGPNPSGSLIISWTQYQNNAIPRQTIAPGSVTVPVVNGAISVSLFPNAAASPVGGCYVVNYRLLTGTAVNQLRYWYIPISSAPVTISEIEGMLPCATTSGALIAPAQIAGAGANAGQVLTWNGTFWAPGNGGGGGAGNPGGTNGQLQFNNLGTFGGFTLGGDCSLSRPNLICASTNGIPFAPSATTDTTNAANISSGLLAIARGSTGTGTTFTQGSVVFAGAAGAYTQDNPNYFYDSALHRLCIGCTSFPNTPSVGLEIVGSTTATLSVSAGAGNFFGSIGLHSGGGGGTGDHAPIQFFSGTNYVWGIDGVFNGTQNFTIRDRNFNPQVSVWNTTADVIICPSPSDTGYRLSVQCNGSAGTAQFFNRTGSGATNIAVQASSSQGSNNLISFYGNLGNQASGVDASGEFFIINSGLSKVALVSGAIPAAGLALSSDSTIAWKNVNDINASGSWDTCLARNTAGVIEVDNCTAGSYQDLIVRNLTISGGVCSGCPGGGTVTNTSGALAMNAVVIGNAGADVKTLGSLGTSGYVLTSNGPSLPPSWQAATGGAGVGYTFCASGCTTTIPSTGATISAATHGQGATAFAYATNSGGFEIFPPYFNVSRDSSGDLTFTYSTAPTYIAILSGAGGGGSGGSVGWYANGSLLGSSELGNFVPGPGVLVAGTFPSSTGTYTFSADPTVVPTVIISSSASPSTYTATSRATVSSYSVGQSFRWTVDTTNTCTTGCTLDINSMGPKTASDAYGNALVAGELGGGSTYTITYNGTKFLCAECRNLFTSTFQGLVPLSGGGTTNFLRADGTWAAPPGGSSGITQLTGDVTAGPGSGSQASTISASAVTLAKMANLAGNSLIGNNTGSSTVPLSLSQGQVTAMLSQFTSSLQGLVPGSGGGTNNFLRADGTWAAPPGTGTMTIVSGIISLSTSPLSSGTCSSSTTTAPNALSTDSIIWNPNGSIKAVTGYAPSTSGGLSIALYATSGQVTADQCNWSSGTITPGAVQLNYRIVR